MRQCYASREVKLKFLQLCIKIIEIPSKTKDSGSIMLLKITCRRGWPQRRLFYYSCKNHSHLKFRVLSSWSSRFSVLLSFRVGSREY